MLRKTCLVIVLIIFPFCLQAQNTFVKQYPDLTDSCAFGLAQSKSGTIGVAGLRQVPNGHAGMFAGATLSNGNLTFLKSYFSAKGPDIAIKMVPTLDGGFIVVGGTIGPNGVYDALVFRISSTGVLKWTKQISGPAYDIIWSIAETPGGYLLAGETLSEDGTRLLVMKMNQSGGVVWKKIYGDTNTRGRSIAATSDGAIIGGMTQGNALFVKINFAGKPLWAKSFPLRFYDLEGRIAVSQSKDGGYVLGGTVLNGNNRAATLTKVDANGAFQWSKQYSSGPGIVHYDSSPVSDGGTLIAGNYSADLLARKALIFKTNQTGAVVWKKIFDQAPSQAGVVREANDGGVIAAGCAGLPLINLITFKLGATGNVDGGCSKLNRVRSIPTQNHIRQQT